MAIPVRPDEILYLRDARRCGEGDRLQRAVRAGAVVRLARAAYLPAERWSELGIEGRHLARMLALVGIRPHLVFSHRSAALAWGLPLIGAPAARPEVIVPLDRADRSDAATLLHRSTSPFVRAVVGGIPVTTLERTLIDVARRREATVSVPMLDFALAAGMSTREQLRAELRSGSHVGVLRCSYALEFASRSSMSPGESVSRVLFDSFGFPRPKLQQRFRDDRGLVGIVDFWWPGWNLIGEFDGLGKYCRDDWAAGGTPAEAVIAEKRREDRLRATQSRPRVVRWGWDDLVHPEHLRSKFADFQ